MHDPQATLPSLGLGNLLGKTLTLVIANLGFLFPLAFVPALIAAVLGQFAGGQPQFDGSVPLEPGPGAFLAIIVNIFISFLVAGVMCLAALDALLGKRHSVGDYLRQTMRHIAPIMLLGAVVYVAAGMAAIFLLLPGLYVLARFLPWTPAIVFENAGWSGLARAQELTEGYRWPLVAATIVIGLIVVALMLVFGPIATMGGPIIAILVEAVFTGLYYALVSVFSALVYMRLREIKEGVTAADLAASID
jgi:hypothetical protein